MTSRLNTCRRGIPQIRAFAFAVWGAIIMAISATAQLSATNPAIRAGYNGADITDSLTAGQEIQWFSLTVSNSGSSANALEYTFYLNGDCCTAPGYVIVPAHSVTTYYSSAISPFAFGAGAKTISAHVFPTATQVASRQFTVGPAVVITGVLARIEQDPIAGLLVSCSNLTIGVTNGLGQFNVGDTQWSGGLQFFVTGTIHTVVLPATNAGSLYRLERR